MVQASVAAPTSVAIQPSPATAVAVSAATDASIAAYIASGEQTRVLAGWVAVAFLGIMLVVAAAWAAGLLPVAVRLF